MNKTVYIMIDCSASMRGSRLDAVNIAMRKLMDEAVPEIRAQKAEGMNVYFKVLGYAESYPNGVKVLLERTELDALGAWRDIAQGELGYGTPTGAAIDRVVKEIMGGNRGEPDMDAVAPAILLISDGEPNGSNPTYEEVLQMAEKGAPTEVRAFRKALRIAIGISVNERGRTSLQRFGKVSKKMEASGIKSYYDCSEGYVDDFVEILKSATINASVT